MSRASEARQPISGLPRSAVRRPASRVNPTCRDPGATRRPFQLSIDFVVSPLGPCVWEVCHDGVGACDAQAGRTVNPPRAGKSRHRAAVPRSPHRSRLAPRPCFVRRRWIHSGHRPGLFALATTERWQSGRSRRTRNLLVAVSARFVLSLEVLICIAKIGRPCRSVPFNTDPWSRVRDQFGDQNVRSTFAIAMVAR